MRHIFFGTGANSFDLRLAGEILNDFAKKRGASTKDDP